MLFCKMRVQRYKKKWKVESLSRKKSYLCSKFNDFMKKIPSHAGLYLIIIGVLVLISTRFSTLGSHNSLLLTGLFFIIAGIVLYIHNIKH